MRSLLVTGASGFVGRHFVAEAVRRGFDISAVGRGPAPSWFPETAHWIVCDLSSPNGLNLVSRDYWGVAHFANMSIPAEYRDDNVIEQSVVITTNLLAHLNSARFLFPSSCHVYAAGYDKMGEWSATVPVGRYGQAKLHSEDCVLSARHLDARIARPFNHIGPHMQQDLMLPSLAARVRQAKLDEPIIMAGKNSVRDFVDVRDIIRGYFILLELDDPSERIFNICSGIGTSIRELAEMMLLLSGKNNPVVFKDCPRSADDTDQLVGDPSRIFVLTNWQPLFSLEDSLKSVMLP